MAFEITQQEGLDRRLDRISERRRGVGVAPVLTEMVTLARPEYFLPSKAMYMKLSVRVLLPSWV